MLYLPKLSPTVTIICPTKLHLGSGVSISDYGWISAKFGVVINDNTLIGPYCIIHSANHIIKNIDIEQNAPGPNSWYKKEGLSGRVRGEPVVIGKDVWIGARVIILAGAKIPDKCVIAAGTTITKSNSRQLKRGDIVANDVKLKLLGNRSEYD